MATLTRDPRRLLGVNEVLMADSIVTEEEQGALIVWVSEARDQGKLVANPRDPNNLVTPFLSAEGGLTLLTRGDRRRQPDLQQEQVWIPAISDLAAQVVPDEFWTIRSRVVALLGVAGLPEDHYKGSFLSYISSGGRVYTHRDGRLRLDGVEYRILRCNVLFSKSDGGGGAPIIAGQEFDIPERGMWAFYATEHVHSSTEVVGSGARWRGTLSFGFLIRASDLWQREFRSARVAPRPDGESGEDLVRELDVTEDIADRRDVVSEDVQRRLLQWVATAEGSFRVADAAKGIGEHPAVVLDELQRLQSRRVVESLSSTLSPRTVVLA